MSLLERGLELAQRCLPESRTGVCVLAYHLVDGQTSTVVDVPLKEFCGQLDWLRDNCEVVSLDDALARAGDGKRRVVLTFDDAYRNFLERAWPELQQRRLPAILYVPVGFIDGSAGPPLTGAALPALTFAELRDLSGQGLTIGSHSVRHKNLRALPSEEVERELSESRSRLEQALGEAVHSFCYPQAKVSRAIARLAARHYRSAVTAGGRPFATGSAHAIPRFPVRRGEPHFQAMVNSSLWLREAFAHELRQFRA